MCLATPGRVLEIRGETGTVDFNGVIRKTNLSLVDCKKGDYILDHVGFAIQKIDKKQAKEIHRLLYET